MLGNWMVGVFLRFETNGIATLGRLAGASKLANEQLMRQQGLIDANTMALNRYNRKVEETRLAWLRGVSLVSGGSALALGGASAYGISNAAKLQLAMQGIYASTGANQVQQAALRNMVLRTSGITAQDAVTIANEAYMASSSGLNSVSRLMQAFPEIAKAADVLWLSTRGTPKAVDPVDASMQMVKFSHLFGAYQGKPLHDMLDFLVRFMMVQPDSLSKAITQAKYFVPTAIAAGINMKDIPSSDIAQQFVVMGQRGLMSGRGGTGLARYIEYMMKAPTMTAHLSKIQRASMIDLGLFDASGHNRFLDSGGNFELAKSLHYLGTVFDDMAQKGQRSRFLGDIYGAFLQQGGQYVANVTQPAVREQNARNILAMQRIAPPGMAVDALWTKYMNDFIPALSLFGTNFKNLWTYVFSPILPELTKDLKDLAQTFQGWGNWLGDHPGAAKDIAHGMMDASLALGALTVFTRGAAVLRWTGLFGAMQSVWSMSGTLGTALRATLVANGLNPAVSAVNMLARALGGMVGVSVALSSTLGKVSSLAGVFFGTTSFDPHSDAAQQLIKNYGVDYYRYLVGRHGKGVYSFSPQDGDLTPQQFRSRRRSTSQHAAAPQVVHVSVNLPAGSDADQAKRIAQLIKNLAGGAHTAALWNIAPGAYQPVPVTG